MMSDERTTSTTNNKSRSVAVPIEALLKQQCWEDARKRLKRIESPKRIGELLYHSADDPHVPDDIFETLLSKLKGKRKSFEPRRCMFEYYFWGGVCNHKRERGYKKEFEDVCHHRSVASLQFFIQDFVDLGGKLPIKTVRETICYLWTRHLKDRSSRVCTREKEEGLLNVSSMEDLRSNEELHSLWQKTELLIKSTKSGGLNDTVQKLPLVRTLIKRRIPKVVVWLAVRLYPEQVRLKDDEGRLPLHWAAVLNNLNTEEDFDVEFEGRLSEILKGRMVELMLDFFPKGAEHADVEGSLPLDLLLNVEYESWTDNSWMQRCALKLMKQAPIALIKRNAKNFMLPFMTAACIHHQNTVKARSKHEEKRMLQRKLKLTYAILRENPSVVTSGISETAQEKYLKRKLEEAHSKIARQDIKSGNWITENNFLDAMRLGPQDELPKSVTGNKGHNRYFALPLILGLLGAWFYYQKHRKDFWIVTLLFAMTGAAIIVYLNEVPVTPRERDYVYVGSFYALQYLIGTGVLYLWDILKRKLDPKLGSHRCFRSLPARSSIGYGHAKLGRSRPVGKKYSS